MIGRDETWTLVLLCETNSDYETPGFMTICLGQSDIDQIDLNFILIEHLSKEHKIEEIGLYIGDILVGSDAKFLPPACLDDNPDEFRPGLYIFTRSQIYNISENGHIVPLVTASTAIFTMRSITFRVWGKYDGTEFSGSLSKREWLTYKNQNGL